MAGSYRQIEVVIDRQRQLQIEDRGQRIEDVDRKDGGVMRKESGGMDRWIDRYIDRWIDRQIDKMEASGADAVDPQTDRAYINLYQFISIYINLFD